MNISEFQHDQNLKQMKELQDLGFRFDITHDKVMIYHGEKFIHGFGSMSGNKKHWKHKKADLRDHLNSAISIARQYMESEKFNELTQKV